MALADVLSIDGDIPTMKSDLMATYQALITSGQDYAKLALKSASAILEVAYAGGTCASVYTEFHDFNRYTLLANNAVVVSVRLSNVLAAINESDDDEANEAYASFLMDLAQTDQISSLLEGANRRVEMANHALPKSPQPAARYNSAVFEHNDG